MPKLAKDWEELVRDALYSNKPSLMMLLGPPAPAVLEECACWGISLTGYSYRVQSVALRHAIQRHSPRRFEEELGQIPLTEAHLNRLPEILSGPFKVEKGAGCSPATPCIRLLREYYGEGTGIIVLKGTTSIQGKFYNLDVATMYWHRPG